MKPFNLKEALEGKPVVTRDGSKIEFIAHDPTAREGFRVLARTLGSACAVFYIENGRATNLPECPSDLFMAPTKREAWVNVYPGGVVYAYPSKGAADRHATGGRIACCRIEWEE